MSQDVVIPANEGVHQHAMAQIKQELTVSYDGQSWQTLDAERHVFALAKIDTDTDAAADDHMLPILPSGRTVKKLMLPLEDVLCRTFSLPLAHTRFIDQDILMQELEEHTSAADNWWLAWHAGQCDGVVSGMMFGLSTHDREQFESHEGWQDLQYLGVDGWERLNAARLKFPDVGQLENSAAVFDADQSGLFFGVWHGKSGTHAEDGFWRGMRRLNWPETQLMLTDANADAWQSLAIDITRSLKAMGWHGETVTAIGTLPAALHAALGIPLWQGNVVESELSSRHEANLALVDDLDQSHRSNRSAAMRPALNFRHGRWRAGTHMGNMQPWYRSMALAACLVLVWAAGMMWQNYQLESQLEAAQQQVIQAFHKGLPQEKVLIDAMAQLRKAAGGSSDGKHGNTALLWLQQVDAMNRVYQQTPWEIRDLIFAGGKMTMAGRVKDLQTMNTIRQALQRETGTPVKIKDTDLSNHQVSFKMAWL